MKTYIKTLTRTIYQKVQRVVQDEYIQPITQTQVYSIINRKRAKSIQNNKNPKSILRRESLQAQQVLDNIERLGLMTPEREFKLIGESYSVEVVSFRVKEMKQKMEVVREHMLDSYGQNLEAIETALMEIQSIKNLSSSRHKSQLLRQRLSLLQTIVTRTQRITQLNIKLKNIKQTLKLSTQIPNIKKLSLFQLKQINLHQISAFKQSLPRLYPQSEHQELACIKHLPQFIDRKASQHLREVIGEITECLVGRFDRGRYERAVREFGVAKSGIEYQRLVVRLVEAEVRDKIEEQVGNKGKEQQQGREDGQGSRSKGDYDHDDGRGAEGLLFRCRKYVAILINLSKVFRWHRYSLTVADTSPQIQQKIRARNNSTLSNCSQNSTQTHSLSTQTHSLLLTTPTPSPATLPTQPSILINTQQIRTHTCTLIDQCLKQHLQQLLFTDSIKNQQVFELLYLTNNFYQVAFSFSSFVFTQSRSTIREILMRKVYKTQEKGVRELGEALAKEEETEWGRLPLMGNYRFRAIERNIEKVRKLRLYENVPELVVENFRFLNAAQGEEENQQEVFQLQSLKNKKLHDPQSSSSLFQLQQLQFPYQKLQKPLSSSTQPFHSTSLPQHPDPQVILCRCSLTILSNFDHLLSMYFYFPIQQIRTDILQKMSFYIEYYMYYLFHTFLSDMYKRMFFGGAGEGVEQGYLAVRVKRLYKEVYDFVRGFEQGEGKGVGCLKETGKKEGNLQESGMKKEVNGIDSASLKGTNSSQKQTNSNKKPRKVSIEMSKYHSRGHCFTRTQIKPTRISQQNGLKARAIVVDSVKYLIAYFSHILNHLQKYTISPNTPNHQQFSAQDQNTPTPHPPHLTPFFTLLPYYTTLQTQLSDLLLTDTTPSSTRIDFVLPIMKKIKWHQLQSSKEITEYSNVIFKNIKETYEKMRSMSKGEIPFYLVDRIFSFYWKTQLTFLVKVFLDEHVAARQRGGKVAKELFERMVDQLYEGLVVEILEHKPSSSKSITSPSITTLSTYTSSSSFFTSSFSAPTSPTSRLQLFRSIYIKIKSIFPILYQPQFPKCRSLITTSLKNFDFIYKIEIGMMKASESCAGLSVGELEDRQREVDQWIRGEVLKGGREE